MLKKLLLSCSILFASATLHAEFDLVPYYGIKVNYSGLKYKEIYLHSSESHLSGKEIPTGNTFNLVINDPTGFKDSAGTARISLVWELTDESGTRLILPQNLYRNNPLFHIGTLSNITLPVVLDYSIKTGTVVYLKAKLTDNRSGSFINLEYKAKVVSSTKNLKKIPIRYNYSTAQGMKGISYGLHYNFFEFKGMKGNNFIYKIQKNGNIHFSLRGMDGWKLQDDKAMPSAKATIYSADGKELRTIEDVLPKEYTKGISADKKELEFQFDPGELNADRFYIIQFTLSDQNNKANTLDLVLKVFVE